MIPLFLEAWKRISDIPLCLVVDGRQPISRDYGLPVTVGSWPLKGSISQPVLESLIAAAGSHSEVIKLDVDCIHLSTAWLDLWQPGQMVALGQMHEVNPACFFGAAYILDVSAAKHAAFSGAHCAIRAEDVGVSYKIRQCYPNGIHLISRHTHPSECCVAGWRPGVPVEKYRRYGIVHCGQSQPREEVSGTMHRLLRDLA